MVSPVVKQFSDIRSNNVKEFQPTLEKSKDMFIISKIKLEVPRTSSKQTLRLHFHVIYSSIEEYYRRSIFLPFLNSLLQQLNDHFQSKTKVVIKGTYLIPSNNEKLMGKK